MTSLSTKIAPRPHNSGNYSIEACDFSQFDTHILGVPLSTIATSTCMHPAAMLNVPGQHVEAAENISQKIQAPTSHVW